VEQDGYAGLAGPDRQPEMSDADEVAHRVLNQVEKQLAAIIKKWKPSWDPKYKDQQ
jgi:hypothetical protein